VRLDGFEDGEVLGDRVAQIILARERVLFEVGMSEVGC
jgi:hypothetical protein